MAVIFSFSAKASSEKSPSDPNAVRLSSFALSLSKGEWASTGSARTANRTVLPQTPFFKRESVASGSLSGFMERSTATTQSGFVSRADTQPLVMPAADQSIRGQATTGILNDLKRQMIKVEKAASLHRVVNVSAFVTNFISMEQRAYFVRSLPLTPVPARSRTGVDCGSVERMKQVTQ